MYCIIELLRTGIVIFPKTKTCIDYLILNSDSVPKVLVRRGSRLTNVTMVYYIDLTSVLRMIRQ